ncbi:MAG: DUF1028 domain-containing protein [Bacteroidales bacterium]|nr:DUF1028 domain-containing protein [Bacteroidales bacterium]
MKQPTSTGYRLPVVAAICLLFSGTLLAQDTFSIVAVDVATGEVGSAGASCVGSSNYYPHGAAILSDVIPGIGGIHTQAAYLPGNQANAHAMMLAGSSPQEIIDWLIANDAGSNPTTRQYGIVDLNAGDPRSAAYSGVNCMDYKNDTAGYAYSIQGNILLGQEIIDSMQNRFLNTGGTLAERLMAALQGAKVIGADTRCASPYQSSSLSAFLRVGKPENSADSLYLDLWMAYPQTWGTVVPVDPIDSLQTLFDQWQVTTALRDPKGLHTLPVVVKYSETGEVVFDFSGCPDGISRTLNVYDPAGRQMLSTLVNGRYQKLDMGRIGSTGIYIYRVTTSDKRLTASGKFYIN